MKHHFAYNTPHTSKLEFPSKKIVSKNETKPIPYHNWNPQVELSEDNVLLR